MSSSSGPTIGSGEANSDTNPCDSISRNKIDEEEQVQHEHAGGTKSKVWFSPLRSTMERMSFPVSKDKIKHKNSLELRKHNIPDSILLKNINDDDVSNADVGSTEDATLHHRGDNKKIGAWNRFFLDPAFPLRRQMLLTFGSISSLTILVVVIASILASVFIGDSIKKESNVVVEEWVDEFTSTTSRLVAEAISPKVWPSDVVDLLVEVARDRFAGYPTTKDDSKTPFFDTQTQRNIYPLQNKPLPLDWDFSHTPNDGGNVIASNAAEHVQGRYPWYSSNPRLSTARAAYTMQGACDPMARNLSAMGYHPNCTEDNNDVVSGGVVAANPTNEVVHRKGADLSPFLKALYESNQDIVSLGYYFSNSGAGSSIFFPHYELDSKGTYISTGCEWMRQPNPINASLGPIGTDEEIARCHPKGTKVPTREFNPLERQWCQDQALNPGRVSTVGPYTSAFFSDKIWFLWSGRAVYDMVTNAFITCISVDINIDGVNKILEEVKVDKLGIATLVRNDDDGTVITSPKFDFDTAESPTTIDDQTLETGVDFETFDRIRSKVDFNQTWDPKNAADAYLETLSDAEGNHIISAYPIPSVPKEYDATYKPEFFAIFSLPKSKGLAPIIDKVNQKVDESVGNIVIFSVASGFIGFVIVILLIFATSSWLVEPLNWMHKVGEQVVGKFGEQGDASIDYERKKSLPCSPKTEFDNLVDEFSKIVSQFSGQGTSKRMRVDQTEKLNLFRFSSDFAALYRSRRDGDFAYNYSKSAPASDTAAAECSSIARCHLGPNALASNSRSESLLDTNVRNRKVYRSPLFLWMVVFIVTPTLFTTVIISAVVSVEISKEIPSLIEPVKEEYYALCKAYRFTKTKILATKASGLAERSARDSHVLMRFASWLYFGGMEATGTFTELIEGAEDCKYQSECDWGKDLPCDCAWNDFVVRAKGGVCTEYSPTQSRYLQKVHFEGQSQDGLGNFPNTTDWWDNITVLPQSSAEAMSSRHGTTYDRVKILSALSTVFVPLYNYDKSDDKPVGIYIGLEADGVISGYRGCSYDFVTYPFWRSTKKNGAAKLRPELCPLQTYGYDPRCRGWYQDGRKKAKAGNGTLHITAPYIFAEGSVVGQSVTMPLVDPQNNNHIGQVLVDFLPTSTLKTLKKDNIKLAEGGFPIMITPESDVLDHDTIEAPGYSLKEGGKPVRDLLPPDDAFSTILQDMKAGKSGNKIFSSIIENSREKIHITFSPVVVRNYHPLNSSDIARGVGNETTLVYSLALVETTKGILKSFQSMNEFSSLRANICIEVLAALIVISTMLIIYVVFRVTTSMTKPILQLLDVMKDVNRMRISNETITKLSRYSVSCREVDSVYQTMEILFKVVQIANSAFFSGDLEVAYQVLRDSLCLFTRLDNKKAIAVASNNLGNTMLTIYRTMKASGKEKICGLSKSDVIGKGTYYYAKSIKLGEDDYDQFYNKQGWSEECLVFMQYLANRYFNRAMFFLTTSGDSDNQNEAETLGFRDLQIASDMDVEVVDQCLEMGFKINQVERHELMTSRVRGLLSLVEIGYSPDELSIEDQINDIYQNLNKAMTNPSHELFKDISVAGRMQKLDTELIKYFSQVKNDTINAAKAAIRMLIEDEYIFPDAEQEAIKMLLTYMNTAEVGNRPKDNNGCIVQGLEGVIETLELECAQRAQDSSHSTLRTSTSSSISRTSSVYKSLGVKESPLSSRENMVGNLSFRRQSGRGDVTMELF